MRKKTLCILLVLVLTMGLTATFSFADAIGNGDASTYSTSAVSIGTKRFSDTKAGASVEVTFTGVADDYVIAIVLQKKTSSGWVTATDVSGSAHYYRGSNKQVVLTYDEWTVKKGVVYRIKCVSTDMYDSGIEYKRTTYSDPF
ncbi:Uncharacterised protein [uncultured Eubacterium sp.]|nr:Uncharacterised protein [uncultured Eubacterium sp.]